MVVVNIQADTTIITSLGPDVPGAAAAFLTALADFPDPLADVHLATVSNHLALTAQCGNAGLEERVREAMTPFGHEVSVAPSYAVALIGADITAEDISAVQETVKGETFRMRRIALDSLFAVELTVTLEDADSARRAPRLRRWWGPPHTHRLR